MAYMFFPVLTRSITGKLITVSFILFVAFSKKKNRLPH